MGLVAPVSMGTLACDSRPSTASAIPDRFGPTCAATSWLIIRLAALMAVSWAPPSSATKSSICLPSTPPAALISSAAICAPCLVLRPLMGAAPVMDPDTPIRIVSPEAWFAVSSGDSPAVPSCRLSSFASPAACVCGDCAAWPPHPDRMENTRHIARVILRYRFFSIM